MSWMRWLYDTYERCKNNKEMMLGEHVLLPVSHTSQNVHIKVILDKDGNFRGAELLGNASLIIPATEDSAGRTSGAAPHPLIDKIHYCAGDYAANGGTKKDNFALYEEMLRGWAHSKHSHPKVRAVYTYVVKKRLMRDLVQAELLGAELFKHVKEPGDALVCWSVEGLEKNADTWSDVKLQQAWVAYDASRMSTRGICMLTGTDSDIAAKHPRNIRWPGDKAKLISSPSKDKTGFTFRGKFDKPHEACTVGYEATHKAHNALRWLIARQGSRQGDQVVLAWATGGQNIPKPDEDDWVLKIPEQPFIPEVAEYVETPFSHAPDIGQSFSLELKKALAGYFAEFKKPTDEIVILGLEAATTGRLSVIFYREKSVEEYLDALRAWQEDCAWLLCKNKTWRHCAPTPREIALAAYGKYVDEKKNTPPILKVDDKPANAVRERLLTCIADRFPLPYDLAQSAVHNTIQHSSDRFRLAKGDWEYTLGITCALYRGYYARHPQITKRRTYAMALEPERTTRDYLFGRLLAVAERIERIALNVANENRPTNAERLMQRFADRPMETWKTLEQAIQPYRQRLLQTRGGFLTKMDKLLDKILSLFKADDFVSDAPLSGEYLLGYHCQRQILWNKNTDNNEDDNENIEEGEE